MISLRSLSRKMSSVEHQHAEIQARRITELSYKNAVDLLNLLIWTVNLYASEVPE